MNKPALAYFNNKKITTIRALSQQEFWAFESARREIETYSRSGQLFAAVLLNYDEYAETNKKYIEDLITRPGVGKDYLDRMVFNLNRRLLNYLCSVRTFLDHNETELKRSKRELEISFIKELLKSNYDESFAYRFLYQLRNYVQHCGMPVGNVIVNAVKDASGIAGKAVTVSVVFDRDTLLNRFDGWKTAKKSLSEMPAQFEIAPLLQELVNRLAIIHFRLNEKLFPNIEMEASFIRKLDSEVSAAEGTAVVLEFIEQENGSADLTIIEFPRMQTQWIMEDRQICWNEKSGLTQARKTSTA